MYRDRGLDKYELKLRCVVLDVDGVSIRLSGWVSLHTLFNVEVGPREE